MQRKTLILLCLPLVTAAAEPARTREALNAAAGLNPRYAREVQPLIIARTRAALELDVRVIEGRIELLERPPTAYDPEALRSYHLLGIVNGASNERPETAALRRRLRQVEVERGGWTRDRLAAGTRARLRAGAKYLGTFLSPGVTPTADPRRAAYVDFINVVWSDPAANDPSVPRALASDAARRVRLEAERTNLARVRTQLARVDEVVADKCRFAYEAQTVTPGGTDLKLATQRPADRRPATTEALAFEATLKRLLREDTAAERARLAEWGHWSRQERLNHSLVSLAGALASDQNPADRICDPFVTL